MKINRKKIISNRINASLGKMKADLIFKNVTYLDVFNLNWIQTDVAIYDGVIIAVETGLTGKKEVNASGKFLVPGFIDAHVHVESSLMLPQYFDQSVIRCGTTTAICDPHEIANVLGTKGIEYFLKASENTAINLKVMLSSCVPATHLETNGAGKIEISKLNKFKNHRNVLGLAEMMNVPGVLHSDSSILSKLDSFQEMNIDGHSPLLRSHELSAYIGAGITSCHESSELEEAKEKVTKGMSVWIREGSVAKDLKTLHSMLSTANSPFIGFCTDDRNPKDIANEGHIDYLIRKSIQYGLDPATVYRSASWSVARHYGLNRGFERVGAIAPGYVADLVLLNDIATCSIAQVYKSGIEFGQIPKHSSSKKIKYSNTIHCKIPNEKDLEAPHGNVNVIGVVEGKIITEHFVMSSKSKGVHKISVLERHKGKSKPSNGYVFGFGENLNGAIASSVGHDSHNLIVVGSNTRDMKVALAKLIESGGGFCVTSQNKVLASLDLPFAGLMCSQTPEEIKKSLDRLHVASMSIGCKLLEPFLQLAFLSLPVIPSLKITDRGLVDVNAFKIISVLAS